MDIRLHRAQGQFQDAGDLLVTVALDVAQQDARAILGSEAGDGVLDGAAQLARFELLQGGFTPVAQLWRGGAHFVRRRGVRGAVERASLELASAPLIDRGAVRDLAEPRREPALRRVRAD